MLVLWFAWVWFAHCAASELQRGSWNVRLGIGIIALGAIEAVAALPVIGAGSSRVLLGTLFFSAYAGWASVPAVHRVYAQIAAHAMVPAGHAYAVVRVDASAMSPTMPRGSYAVVDFSAYATRDPRAGDVVAVAVGRDHVYLKRIVALPGDAFAVTGLGVLRNGVRPPGWRNRAYPSYDLSVQDDTILVDGVPLDRSVASVPGPDAWSDPARLPADCYFVLGDNINNSEDSHVFGCVSRTEIVGRVIVAL